MSKSFNKKRMYKGLSAFGNKPVNGEGLEEYTFQDGRSGFVIVNGLKRTPIKEGSLSLFTGLTDVLNQEIRTKTVLFNGFKGCEMQVVYIDLLNDKNGEFEFAVFENGKPIGFLQQFFSDDNMKFDPKSIIKVGDMGEVSWKYVEAIYTSLLQTFPITSEQRKEIGNFDKFKLKSGLFANGINKSKYCSTCDREFEECIC